MFIVGLLQIGDNYKLIFFVKLDVKVDLTKLKFRGVRIDKMYLAVKGKMSISKQEHGRREFSSRLFSDSYM